MVREAYGVAKAPLYLGHKDVANPIKMLACRWVPVQERSRSLALVYSGMYTGSILGLALSPHMIEVRATHGSTPMSPPHAEEGAQYLGTRSVHVRSCFYLGSRSVHVRSC